ncbi:MAG TPA: hypothetical protein VEZ90_02170 [Blastocatellia bacterium]|nr:hypothetical protein [Blastocatellia bacterium]
MRSPNRKGRASPQATDTILGERVPRIDAYERVSGSAVYARDLILPDMLHAAVLRCPFPHALVKSLDTSKAEKLPGVRALLTNADREARIVLPYPWWVPLGPPMMLFDTHCRYAGEEVAVVAAESPDQAYDAVRAIEVE